MDFSVTSSRWDFSNNCDWDQDERGGSDFLGDCDENDMSYFEVGSNKNRAYYEAKNLPPHSEVKIIIDGYLLDSTSDTYKIKYEV